MSRPSTKQQQTAHVAPAEPLHRRRSVSVFLVTAVMVAATVLPLAAQGGNSPSLQAAAALQPTTKVALLGDGFMAGSEIEPLAADECRRSLNGPAESMQGIRSSLSLTVENVACEGATLQSVRTDQIPQVSADVDMIFVGGTAFGFDLDALAAACLEQATRSRGACIDAASTARASGANSFLGWNSLLTCLLYTSDAADE